MGRTNPLRKGVERGLVRPISVLSNRQQAAPFVLTCAHSDDSL